MNLVPYTWAKTNPDNIQIYNEDSDKKGFTALATILRDGTKLPLIFIANGKSHTIENNWFGGGRSINPSQERVLD